MKLSRDSLQSVLQLLQAVAIYLSVVTLITLQFLRNSLPAPHLVLFPTELLVKAVIFFILVPALLLFVADRLINWRLSPRSLLIFRSALMLVALVIGMRQLQLFWDPAESLANEIQEIAVPLFPLAFLAVSGLLAYLIVRFHSTATTFFVYFAPAAVILAAMMPFEEDKERGRFDLYSNAEVLRPEADSAPVYVLVFDELSYEALLGPDGGLDASAYPSFARLAAEGMHLTNATSHHFYTWLVIPEMLDALLPLAEDYEVRFYEQAERLEGYFAPACGSQVTCRGTRHLTLNKDSLAFELAARALYSFLPERVESIARPVLHPALRTVGVVSPPSDPLGMHVTSPDLLSQFLSDISSETARGRISFLHSLLPHHPLVFDAGGDFSSDEYRRIGPLAADESNRDVFDERWRQYREQIGYVDAFLGDFLERLESEGLLEEAIVIVTADHGQRIHFPVNSTPPVVVESISANVPFFILGPGLPRGATDVDYQHADFGPTLYDLLGLDPSDAAVVDSTRATGDGRSVFSENAPQRDKTFLVYDYRNEPHFWRYRLETTSGQWQLVDEIDWIVGDRTLTGIQVGGHDLPP